MLENSMLVFNDVDNPWERDEPETNEDEENDD